MGGDGDTIVASTIGTHSQSPSRLSKNLLGWKSVNEHICSNVTADAYCTIYCCSIFLARKPFAPMPPTLGAWCPQHLKATMLSEIRHLDNGSK